MKTQNRIRSTALAQLVRAVCSIVLIIIAIGLLPLSFAQNSKQAQAASSEQPQACTVAAGPDMPTPLVRAVGVFFPANGKFYAMGGRTADGTGNDAQNPREYNPATNTWATRAETTPDNFMNNMACGVLTDAGTPWIYCVGGSFGGGTTGTARVFRFNPVTGVMQNNLGTGWPGGADGITLPGGFSVYNNKLYLFGGFQINTAMKNGIWEFTPGTNVWVTKGATLPNPLGYIPTATVTSSVGTFIYLTGGSNWDGTTINDQNDSNRYDPATDTILGRAVPPRVVAETRSLTLSGTAYVMGGGRTPPNPNNEVDIYDPVSNSWSLGTPFVTARRNFPTDTDGSKIWLAGGYAADGITPLSSMEIFTCATPLGINSAVSRKVHGAAGTFDIPMPLTAPDGVECRNTGGTHDYSLVVTFSQNVTVTGSPQAQVTSGTGCVGTGGVCNGNVSVSGAIVTIPLTNIADAQNINVRINGVNGASDTPAANFDIPMGFLTGDTNGNRTVNAADVAQTKGRLGQTVGASNFRSDVNANGSINAADTALVKGNSGHSIP